MCEWWSYRVYDDDVVFFLPFRYYVQRNSRKCIRISKTSHFVDVVGATYRGDRPAIDKGKKHPRERVQFAHQIRVTQPNFVYFPVLQLQPSSLFYTLSPTIYQFPLTRDALSSSCEIGELGAFPCKGGASAPCHSISLSAREV